MILLLKFSILIVLISFEFYLLQVDGAPIAKNDHGKKMSNKVEEQAPKNRDRSSSSSYEYYSSYESNSDRDREKHDAGKKEEHHGEREKRSGGERGEESVEHDRNSNKWPIAEIGIPVNVQCPNCHKDFKYPLQFVLLPVRATPGEIDYTGTLKGGMAKLGNTIMDGIRGLKPGPSDPKKDALPEPSPPNNPKSAKNPEEPTPGKQTNAAKILGNLAAGSKTLMSKVQTGAADLGGTLKNKLPMTANPKNIQKNEENTESETKKGDTPEEKKKADKDGKEEEGEKVKAAKKKDEKPGKADKSTKPEKPVGNKSMKPKLKETEKTKKSES